MKITGADYLKKLDEAGSFTAKMVFNDKGAVIFDVHSHHRDMRAPGIAYEDDSGGNAIAAMLMPKLIEVRFHLLFSDDRVVGIIRKLLACPELAFVKGWKVKYQGRILSIS